MNIMPAHKKDKIKKIFVFRAINIFLVFNIVIVLIFVVIAGAWLQFTRAQLHDAQKTKKYYQDMFSELKKSKQNTSGNIYSEIVQKIYTDSKLPLRSALMFALESASQFNGDLIIRDISVSKKQDKINIKMELASESKESIINFIKILKSSAKVDGIDMEKVIASMSRKETGEINFSVEFNYLNNYEK